ncbi:haloacid dehalogenase superfamily, subfamily IA, variant 3 with third motif having DD or ED/haloacid dehalogenase superfamily, subfamily IA, variant 1 with third motif having Dx(3-4)D or Dx(3-4)E [Micromonospora pattaloongensis]|uniref:Haloacid dehalogenase superfamily, subfamily IA, variant 3 with third motif having DD or ED/haloacid dehalogenase superfamily, subfamily IA, variant 1 with third motif having Dx(3-4)D or Dx(3-4)E n=1 Tax=Micromonospora pattaloongensis TaxID=405436 RepID=A0A1H3S8Q3_9ACTN|nr:HAD family hydrolase [Micromonospora pattaloongensis]SDZ33931.1 haloacid dehalogenase superfamily, subfamily IA, variant 3 with third motif having DD or ED/haloacid dehalogenase superfamily, subfamily IA, variant 1 with third motif having Dx(3-4)D or Dx(3-4)E [Micromonospora pattaloongensis]
MTQQNRPAGVLFDVDGTLVDTTYLHTVAWWEALRQSDHVVPMSRIHRAIGMGADNLLDHLLGAGRDRGADDRLRAAHSALYAEYWPRLRPLPGATDLLRACAKRGLRVVLASSATGREVDVLRAVLDVDDVLAGATSGSDAAHSKPAPDIVQAALADAGLDADRVVFVGDSVWDVAAAGRLSIPCVAVACGGTSHAELADAGAVAVYDDPAALLSELDTSPIASLG